MARLKRILDFHYLVIILGIVLISRLFYLQVIRYAYYEDLSIKVRSRVIPNVAPRGIIYDRYGKILATNRPLYYLYLLPKEIKEPALLKRFLKETCNISYAQFEAKLNEKRLPFQPILMKKFLSVQELSAIEENKRDFPAMVIGVKITRDYPYKNTAAHVIGYTGEITEREMKMRKGYRLNDIIGLSGVERYYDRYLKGINGGEQIEVDALGNPNKTIKALSVIPGDDLYLTLDIELCRYIDSLLTDVKGAVVVLDANSGELLTLISKPDYDPNYFTDFLTETEWQQIQKADHPLHNRAITGYPPASTFKIFVALAALETKAFTENSQFYSGGGLNVGGIYFADWRAHGNLDFFQGLVYSSNVVFYRVGMKLGPELIGRYATMFGLGTPTRIDLPFEGKGFVPDTKWKRKVLGQDWYPGDTLNLSIGQGFLLVSPLQLATAFLPIANSSHSLYRPFVVKKIIGQNNQVLMQKEPELVSSIRISEATFGIIKRALRAVVTEGTGTRANLPNFPVAGKTGTAQISRRAILDHAWFVSYAPANDPEIVTAVFIETGGHGGDRSASVARDIYAWWQKNRSNYGR